MSIEVPEAKILAEEMGKELKGKRIIGYSLKNHEKLQRIGMLNKNPKDFDQLINGEIEDVISRGNVIRLRLNNGANLILGPEYGGEVLFHKKDLPQSRYHLKIDFGDGSSLTVRLASLGAIQVMRDDELHCSYVYRRDFNYQNISPLEEEFTLGRFSELMGRKSQALKSTLVGKDAVVVGVSNSIFQDMLYRARINPRRKASDLNAGEVGALYNALRHVIQERIRLNGKYQFRDLYGRQGTYQPAMGPNMNGQRCGTCGTPIESMSLGGGLVYLCPSCQKWKNNGS